MSIQTKIRAKLDKDSMIRESYFPTTIFRFSVAPEVVDNDHILDLVYAARKEDQEGIERSNFKSLGGWHSHNNLHKDTEYASLVTAIDDAGALMSSELGYAENKKISIGTMWSIINPPGGANRAHIHPDCIWSGVYYVQAPKDCGQIEFTDPRTQNLMIQPKFRPSSRRPRHCWTKVRFDPKPGKMLIFPSWLYHGVMPNVTKAAGDAANRVIISFNLNQQNK